MTISKKPNTYTNGRFADVNAKDWYFDNVKAAYELGLMIGQGEKYAVDSDVTVGETVTLAARLHSIYSGDGQTFRQGPVWYQVYADYVKAKKLVDLSGFDMTAYATRAQYAAILGAALPDEALKSVSNVADNAIPDVKIGDACAEPIYKLYRAGILTGTNDSGTYLPNEKIKRSEVAAIVTRMADTSLRKTITLGDFHTVTFNPNYSGASNQTVTVESGKTVTAPADPTRSGYSFDGWYTDISRGKKFDFKKSITDNITLYAYWTKDKSDRDSSDDSKDKDESKTSVYSVTFDSNGGSEIFKQRVASGKRVVKPAAPTKEGYTFGGWYIDTELTTEYNFTAVVRRNLTLYAQWESVLALTSPELELVESEDGDYYYLSSKMDRLTGTVADAEEISEFSYEVRDFRDTILSEGIIASHTNWETNDVSFLFGYNHLSFTIDFTGGERVTQEFHIINTDSTNEMGLGVDLTVDSDCDGIPNYYETVLGTDTDQLDTDGDGLSDGLEYIKLRLSPSNNDTDGNGINDDNEDCDSDGLTNLYEIANLTDPCNSDTDGDSISDGREVHLYGTDPLLADTDADGVNDDIEVQIGTDPLTFDVSFDLNYKYPNEDKSIKPMLTMEGLNAEQVNGISISEVTSGQLSDTQIPGYIDTAFSFSEIGDFDSAVLSFDINPSLFDDEDFKPAIYWYDEENEMLVKLADQVLTGNTISATVTHFSKYIVLDSTKQETVWQAELLYDESGEEPFQAIDVVFVLDTSGSMSWNDPYFDRRKVTKNFIDQLTEKDLAAVVGFDSYSEIYSGLTFDKDTLYTAVDRVDNSGGTSLSAGIGAALSLFTSSNYCGEDRLKFIVMLTDGDGGYSSRYTVQATDAGVIIYTVGLGNAVNENLLRTISEKTGGSYCHASRADELNAIFERIVEETDLYKDSDSDGLADYYEKKMALGNLVLGTGVRITGINYLVADTDGDGLNDGQEIKVRKVGNRVFLSMTSNPTIADTDRDGISDKEDPKPFVPYVSTTLLYQSKRLRGLNENGNRAPDLLYSDEDYQDLLSHGQVFEVANTTPEWMMWAGFGVLFGVGTVSASDEMRSVRDDMIKRFQDGTGASYTSNKLTQAIWGDTGRHSVAEVAGAVKSFVIEKIQEYDGDLSALKFSENSDVTKAYRTRINSPYFGGEGVLGNIFNGDTYNGFSILFHDFHGWTVTIKNYRMTNNTFSGTIHFHYYDNFGLDADDEITHAGFCDWYTLQHYKRFEEKYKPFISDIEYDVDFSGIF